MNEENQTSGEIKMAIGSPPNPSVKPPHSSTPKENDGNHPVDVFIAWSGDESKEVALALKSWLPKVLPDINPWMSDDIAVGVQWSPEINDRLSHSKYGIICITRENLESRWIHFEAGALSTQLGYHGVCPLLVDVPESELKEPLKQFHAAHIDHKGEGILGLLNSLNKIMVHPYPSRVIDTLFKHHWLKLKKAIFKTHGLTYSQADIYEFSTVTDDTFFSDQLEAIDCNNIQSIDIMGHTGENLIKAFLAELDKRTELKKNLIKNKDFCIRVLLREPISEISTRVKGLERTVVDMRRHREEGLQIFLNFYQNLPTFRSFIIKYGQPGDDHKNQQGFFTFYYFPLDGYSKKYPQKILVEKQDSEKKYQVLEIHDSWFNCFWGKSDPDQLLHTIIFDFDDTIVNSHNVQIEAWMALIENILQNGGGIKFKVKPDGIDIGAKKVLDKDKFKTWVTRIFFQNQLADDIFSGIFEEPSDGDLKNRLRQKRFEIRKEKMTTDMPNLFDGVKEVIRDLSEKYNLVIISATDENMISDHLSTYKFDDGNTLFSCFKYIFGKKEEDFKWGVDRKSQLIHKITSIIGVPVERMVYVGDNNSDFLAAQSINIDFIEARLFSNEVKQALEKEKDSLVFDDSQPDQRKFFTDWNKLEGKLAEVEKDKKNRRKERYGF